MLTPESMAMGRTGAAVVVTLAVVAFLLLDYLGGRIRARLEARFKASRDARGEDDGGPE